MKPIRRGQDPGGTETTPTLTSAVQVVANRLALAGANTLFPAWLSETGREGTFVWNGSDLSAKVTADTMQGIYVAAVSDATGASGAWVRQFSGKANVLWWGVFGDWNGSTGTGQSAKINAALATLNAIKTTAIYGYSKGSPGLFIPAQQLPYYIDADIDVYHTLEIEWENGAGPSGGAAVWKCAAGVTGIRTHSNTSTGRNGETTNRGYSAVGTTLRSPFIIGGFTTTEGEFYGIQMRVKTFIYDPYIEGFQGDGIFGDTSGVDNLNGALIWNPFVTGCRDGIYINQNNANALQIYNPEPFGNRRFGIVIENDYGGTIYGGNSAGNGLQSFAPYTQSFNNGHVFGVLYGQETWCSTNSPPSTATTNTGWKYLYDIGVAQAQAPQWVTGQTWRAGGCIRITGGSTRGAIIGHEAEGGQMPILLTAGGRMVVFGGLQGPGNPITETGAIYGAYLDADSGGFYAGGFFPYADNTGLIGGPSERFAGVYAYTIDAKGNITALGTVTGSNLSGTNTGDQFTAMTSSRFLGRVTAGAGAAEQLTGTQATALLDVVASGTKGLAPASGGGTVNYLRADGTWAPPAGSGSVTTVSVVTANGVSGSVANATTTPAITLTLGAITPTSVAASGTVTGSNLSGTNTGDQTITLTGNVTGSGVGSFATTIAASAVTRAMMANTSAATVLGSTAAGAVAELTASQARTVLGLGTVATLASDTDGTLAANSDNNVATEKAVKAYVDNQIGLPPYISGNWYLAQNATGTQNGTATGNGTIKFMPFVVRRPVTVSQLGIRITTTNAGNVRLGVYASNATTGNPTGNPLSTVSGLSTASAANVSGALGSNIALSPGLYWFALQADNATVAFLTPTSAVGESARIIGDSSLTNLLRATNDMLNGLSLTGTYAGGMGDVTSSTFSVNTGATGGVVAFKVA